MVSQRQAFLIALIDEFLLVRARMDAPLVAGDVYAVHARRPPPDECYVVRRSHNLELRKEMLAAVAAQTAALVAPRYPDLQLTAPEHQYAPGRNRELGYMLVNIALRQPAAPEVNRAAGAPAP